MKRLQTVSYAPGRETQTPMLRIANRFLLKYGFNIGDKVEVEYTDGIITIILKPKL